MGAISGTVGAGGDNRRQDVVTVQAALNRLVFSTGGPRRDLVVDGDCGPMTSAALERFLLVSSTGSTAATTTIGPSDDAALAALGLAEAPAPGGRLAGLAPTAQPEPPRSSRLSTLRLPSGATTPASPPGLEVEETVPDPHGDGTTTTTVWTTGASPMLVQGAGARAHAEVALRVTHLPSGTGRFRVQVSGTPLAPDDPAPAGLLGHADHTDSETDRFTISLPPSRGMKRPGATVPATETLVLRAVPLDSDGTPRLPVSNDVTVSISNVKIAGATPAETAARQARQAASGLRVTHVGFEPATPPDPRAHEYFVVTRDLPPVYSAGDRIHRTPDDGSTSGFEAVGGAVVSVVDFVASSTNWVSQAWTDIQKGVVDFVADDILDCGDPCRTALTYGMQAAMAGLGVPPSIPNFDQLVAMGKGYVVEVVTTELNEQSAVPVPREVAQRCVDELVKQVEDAASHGPSGDWWLRPDPAKQGSPAVLHVTVTNTASTPSPSWDARVDHPLYGLRPVPLPALGPGERVEVPVIWDGLGDYRSRWPYIDDSWKTNMFPSKEDLLIESWWDAYNHEAHEVAISFGEPDTDWTQTLRMDRPLQADY